MTVGYVCSVAFFTRATTTHCTLTTIHQPQSHVETHSFNLLHFFSTHNQSTSKHKKTPHEKHNSTRGWCVRVYVFFCIVPCTVYSKHPLRRESSGSLFSSCMFIFHYFQGVFYFFSRKVFVDILPFLCILLRFITPKLRVISISYRVNVWCVCVRACENSHDEIHPRTSYTHGMER